MYQPLPPPQTPAGKECGLSLPGGSGQQALAGDLAESTRGWLQLTLPTRAALETQKEELPTPTLPLHRLPLLLWAHAKPTRLPLKGLLITNFIPCKDLSWDLRQSQRHFWAASLTSERLILLRVFMIFTEGSLHIKP